MPLLLVPLPFRRQGENNVAANGPPDVIGLIVELAAGVNTYGPQNPHLKQDSAFLVGVLSNAFPLKAILAGLATKSRPAVLNKPFNDA